MIGIYRITSPTGRIYIGQSINIEKRWSTYKRFQCKSQRKLYNSLKKHGWDNHIKDILELCSEDNLLERENYYKDLYHVLDSNSLCCRYDGKGGRDSFETRLKKSTPKNLNQQQKLFKNQKIQKANMGKKRTQEQKDKLKKPRTEEHKNNISKALQNRDISWEVGRPKRIIMQYTLDNYLIKEWDTITKAASYYNISSSNIVACCAGRYKNSGGFIWRYKE
jgi:group I intron endonuclease